MKNKQKLEKIVEPDGTTVYTAKLSRWDKWISKNRWVITPILYVVMCVYTFFNTTVVVDGVVLSQTDSGFMGLAFIHALVIPALICAYVLYRIVILVSKLLKSKP